MRAMGFLVSKHGHARWRCDTPPPPREKGYLSDTCAIPYENKAKRVRYPPLRYDLERVLRDMGGVSRTGPLSAPKTVAGNVTLKREAKVEYIERGEQLLRCRLALVLPLESQRAANQTGISPEFRTTWLSRREKKGHFRPFSVYFPVFGAKRARRKTRAQPWYAHKSGLGPLDGGAPKTPNSTTTDLTPHLRPSENLRTLPY